MAGVPGGVVTKVEPEATRLKPLDEDAPSIKGGLFGVNLRMGLGTMISGELLEQLATAARVVALVVAAAAEKTPSPGVKLKTGLSRLETDFFWERRSRWSY